MPLNIVKPKEAEKPAENLTPASSEKTVDQLSDEELADLYGNLSDQVQAANMNPVFARFEQVQKELQKRLEEQLEPQDTAELTGDHWELNIGAAAKNPRVLVDGAIPKIQAALGVDTFGKIAKVGIGDLEKYMTPQQLTDIIKEDTGFSNKRKITVKFLG